MLFLNEEAKYAYGLSSPAFFASHGITDGERIDHPPRVCWAASISDAQATGCMAT